MRAVTEKLTNISSAFIENGSSHINIIIYYYIITLLSYCFNLFQTVTSTDRKSVKKYGNKLNAIGSPSRSRSSTKELRCNFYLYNLIYLIDPNKWIRLFFISNSSFPILFKSLPLSFSSITRWSHVPSGLFYSLSRYICQWRTVARTCM